MRASSGMCREADHDATGSLAHSPAEARALLISFRCRGRGRWPGRGPSRSPDAIVLTAALTRSAAVTPLPAAAEGTASQRTQNDPSVITLPAIPTGPKADQCALSSRGLITGGEFESGRSCQRPKREP